MFSIRNLVFLTTSVAVGTFAASLPQQKSGLDWPRLFEYTSAALISLGLLQQCLLLSKYEPESERGRAWRGTAIGWRVALVALILFVGGVRLCLLQAEWGVYNASTEDWEFVRSEWYLIWEPIANSNGTSPLTACWLFLLLVGLTPYQYVSDYQNLWLRSSFNILAATCFLLTLTLVAVDHLMIPWLVSVGCRAMDMCTPTSISIGVFQTSRYSLDYEPECSKVFLLASFGSVLAMLDFRQLCFRLALANFFLGTLQFISLLAISTFCVLSLKKLEPDLTYAIHSSLFAENAIAWPWITSLTVLALVVSVTISIAGGTQSQKYDTWGKCKSTSNEWRLVQLLLALSMLTYLLSGISVLVEEWGNSPVLSTEKTQSDLHDLLIDNLHHRVGWWHLAVLLVSFLGFSQKRPVVRYAGELIPTNVLAYIPLALVRIVAITLLAICIGHTAMTVVGTFSPSEPIRSGAGREAP